MTEYLRPFQSQLLDQISMSLPEVDETGISKGILLIGDSGVGKTHAFDQISQQFLNGADGKQVQTPAIRVSLKTKADAASISKSALLQLGRPILQSRQTKLDDLEGILHDALRARQTRIVMLEEFHNGLLAGASAIRTQNRHFLKNLWNMHNPNSPLAWVSAKNGMKPWGIVIVVSATIELLKPLAQDKELKSRFNTIIEANNLALFPAEVFDELRRVLKTMLKRYGLSERVTVNDRDFVAQMFFATNGHLRSMNDIVQRAATLSKSNAAQAEINGLFFSAYEQIGGGYGAIAENPFSWNNQELVTNVAKAQLKQKPAAQGAVK